MRRLVCWAMDWMFDHGLAPVARAARRALCAAGSHDPWCRGRADHQPLVWDGRHH